MSIRYWVASASAVCVALFLTTALVHAAEPAAQPEPVWKGLVPDDAFLAVVAYPRRLVTSKSLEKDDAKILSEELEPDFGFSPLDLDQVTILVGPIVSVNQWRKQPQFAIICRLSKDIDRDRLSRLWFQWPERFLLAGHRCFRRQQTTMNHEENEMAACYLDDRTFVVASQTWLPAVLRAHDAESKLIHALASTDMAADLTMIFTSTAGARDVAAAAFPERGTPEPLRALANFCDLVSAVKLTVHSSPEIGLKLTLVANDETAASQIVDLVKVGQQLGQQVVTLMQRIPARTPTDRESRDYAVPIVTKIVDQFVAQRTGKFVSVDISQLGTVKSLFDKAIMPPFRAERLAEHIAAMRSQNGVNLKQLSMAMLMHAQTAGALPTHAIYSKDGKPLLSWRVALLPELGYAALYKEFALDEPWDSAHNKPLIAKMPALYKSAIGKPLTAGQTCFLVPVGEGTLFDGQKGVAIKDISDGLANTVELIEVGPDRAVTWTKPDDVQFDPQNPLAGVGTIGDAGPLVALANGSTPTIRKTIDPETFRWLVLRADGHVIDHNGLSENR